MKKRKTLEDKKRELDEQAAAALAAKKAKLQKETPPAPSESEIDMGVFSAKRGVKLGKTSRKIDISEITPPTSPPSRTLGLSSPPEDLGEREKQIHVGAEQVGEGGDDGAGGASGAGGDGRGKGVETEAESSKATPRHTIYTRRPPGAGGGATSNVPQSHEFENIQAGSWDTHNPACDDLPHAPRWNLIQASQMNDHANCQEFFNLSPPLLRGYSRKGTTVLISWMIIFMPGSIFLLPPRRLFESGS
ncbi:hypothetical protein HanPI659440_Chr15g0611791 [Helianthus annuus]|nr:hypothetical protein HanPI659440_Chr15g0611791 [Helianthus annuus]